MFKTNQLPTRCRWVYSMPNFCRIYLLNFWRIRVITDIKSDRSRLPLRLLTLAGEQPTGRALVTCFVKLVVFFKLKSLHQFGIGIMSHKIFTFKLMSCYIVDSCSSNTWLVYYFHFPISIRQWVMYIVHRIYSLKWIYLLIQVLLK